MVSFVRREWWSWRCGRVGKLPGQREHTKGAPAVSASRFQASPRPKGRFYMQGAARALAKASQSFALSRTRAWPGVGQGANQEGNACENARRRQRKVWIQPPLASTHSKLFSLHCRSSCKQRTSRTFGALCQMPHLIFQGAPTREGKREKRERERERERERKKNLNKSIF